MDKGIWVTGSGTAMGARDECVITVGSEVRRPSAAGALASSAESLEQMRAVLLASGLTESALATSAVSLNPVYDEYPTVAGFQRSRPAHGDHPRHGGCRGAAQRRRGGRGQRCARA